ncbi:MAG: Ig-like domain-containing protein [Gemmatimonadales bacterium]
MLRTFLPSLTLAALVLAACSDDSTGPGGPEPVARVELTTPVTEVAVGQTLRLSAVARSASGAVLPGRSITWASSSPEVAGITRDGHLTAAAEGVTTVTATSEGKRAETRVRVTAIAVERVEIRQMPRGLVVGETAHALAMAVDAGGQDLPHRAITWTSSRPAVATIAADGSITALAEGSTVISASSEGRQAEAALEVSRGAATLDRIVILEGDRTALYIGQTQALTAQGRTATGEVIPNLPITWSSTNTDAVLVSNGGIIEGIFTGEGQVIARSGDKADTIAVSVRAAVERVVMDPTTLTMVVGEVAQVNAQAYGGDNVIVDAPITWRSENAGVATVTNGRITALKAGTVTISATVQGVRGTTLVTIVGSADFEAVSANGRTLPTLLFSAAETDGTTTRYDVSAGTLRLTGAQRYEQRFELLVTREGQAPVGGTYITSGSVSRDPVTGLFHFQPDEATRPAFTGEKLSDTTLVITQRYLDSARPATVTYQVR